MIEVVEVEAGASGVDSTNVLITYDAGTVGDLGKASVSSADTNENMEAQLNVVTHDDVTEALVCVSKSCPNSFDPVLTRIMQLPSVDPKKNVALITSSTTGSLPGSTDNARDIALSPTTEDTLSPEATSTGGDMAILQDQITPCNDAGAAESAVNDGGETGGGQTGRKAQHRGKTPRGQRHGKVPPEDGTLNKERNIESSEVYKQMVQSFLHQLGEKDKRLVSVETSLKNTQAMLKQRAIQSGNDRGVIEKLDSHNARLTREKNQSQSSASIQAAALKTEKETSDALRQELDTLGANSEQEEAKLQEQLSISKAANSALMEKNQGLVETQNEAERTQEKLQKELQAVRDSAQKSLDTHATELTQSELLVRELCWKLETANISIETGKRKMEGFHKDLVAKNARVFELESINHALKQDQEASKNEMTGMKRELRVEGSYYRYARSQVKSLEKDSKLKEDKLIKAESLCKDLQEQLGSVKNDLESEQKEAARSKARTEELLADITSLKADVDAKALEIIDINASKDQLQEEKNFFQGKVKDQEQSLSDAAVEIVKSNSVKQQLLEDNECLKKQVQDEQHAVSQAAVIRSDLEEQLATTQAELDLKRSMLSEMFDRLKGQVALTEALFDKIKIKIGNMQEKHRDALKAAMENAEAAAKQKVIEGLQFKNVVARTWVDTKHNTKKLLECTIEHLPSVSLVPLKTFSNASRWLGWTGLLVSFLIISFMLNGSGVMDLPPTPVLKSPVHVYGTEVMMIPGIESLPGGGVVAIYDPYPNPFRVEKGIDLLKEDENIVEAIVKPSIQSKSKITSYISYITDDSQVNMLKYFPEVPAPTSIYTKIGSMMANTVLALLTWNPPTLNGVRGQGWR